MKRLLALLVPLATFVLFACDGETTSNTPTDAGGGGSDAAAEAASDAAAEDGDAATCDIGAIVPNLPQIQSEFVIMGSDAGTDPPASTGGDETGTWIQKKVTVYLPPQAQGQIDPAQSKVTGTGFSEFGGGKFRTFIDTETTIQTTALGKIVQGGRTKAKGTYTGGGTVELTTTSECRETNSSATTNGKVGFSRLSPTTARLVIVQANQLGTVTIVTEVEKAP
jgi:hypothetical protein